MTSATEKVLEEALQLPPVERASLVEHLLESFEFTDRKHLEDLWAEEAEDRIDAFEKGQIPSTPAKDVFAKLK